MRIAAAILLCGLTAGCRAATDVPGPAAAPAVRNLVIITVDTLRTDRVGAYGSATARTPAIDRLAHDGARFAHAYATAPITLTSHASLMSGRYPAGHGARHNGMRLEAATPTLAGALAGAGFATGGFVAAYPLDRRFGLIKGFQTYGDRMPRRNGRVVNERPGSDVVDEALTWLAAHRATRFFLWVHLFEPHAPYGDPADPRGLTPQARYDEDVAEADRQVGRVLDALGTDRASTLVVFAADHGEAFGEHGEIGHSIFIYDTTLRVPLIFSGARIPRGRVVDDPVSLVDVVPTAMRLAGLDPLDADGVDLAPVLAGAPLPPRDLYAESFAPLLDFGWSPLQTVRSGGWKYIEAPRPELYDIAHDPDETQDLGSREPQRVAAMHERVIRRGGGTLAAGQAIDPESRERLQALGYVNTGRASTSRADPKDRSAEAARMARLVSGELRGAALERALRDILADDPGNPQAHLRLGYLLLDAGRCGDAEPHFRSAMAGHVPSVDAHLGLAACDAAARRFAAATATLRDAERIEPGNPVVSANLGLVLADAGRPGEAVAPLQRALGIDPDLHQARFTLALALARTGRRADAASTARDLLRRLPASAPQRPEVERLVKTLGQAP